jgi:hypothetical protein
LDQKGVVCSVQDEIHCHIDLVEVADNFCKRGHFENKIASVVKILGNRDP